MIMVEVGIRGAATTRVNAELGRAAGSTKLDGLEQR